MVHLLAIGYVMELLYIVLQLMVCKLKLLKLEKQLPVDIRLEEALQAYHRALQRNRTSC